MNIERMRSEISSMYPGERWKNRCANMPDNQVIAIFCRFRNNDQKPVTKTVRPYQYTMKDYGVK
jgi:hypothetical protein